MQKFTILLWFFCSKIAKKFTRIQNHYKKYFFLDLDNFLIFCPEQIETKLLVDRNKTKN